MCRGWRNEGTILWVRQKAPDQSKALPETLAVGYMPTPNDAAKKKKQKTCSQLLRKDQHSAHLKLSCLFKTQHIWGRARLTGLSQMSPTREITSAEEQINHLFLPDSKRPCRLSPVPRVWAFMWGLDVLAYMCSSNWVQVFFLDKFYSRLWRELGPEIIYAQRFK